MGGRRETDHTMINESVKIFFSQETRFNLIYIFQPTIFCSLLLPWDLVLLTLLLLACIGYY